MSKRKARPRGRPEAPRAGYEERDVNAQWIFGLVVFLLLSCLVMHFCLAGFMQRLSRKPSAQDTLAGVPRRASVAQERQTAPRLQVMPSDDLKKFRAQEDAELHSYGWVNRTSGVVRVPIERAIELVLERGLPVRAGSNEDQTGPSSLELQQQRVP